MMDINSIDLLSLQSGYMQRDPFTKALCEALTIQLLKISENIPNVLIYYRIEELDGATIDQLALEWHVDGYDQSDSLEIRRRLVRNSFKMHKYKGTVYAVKIGLDSLFGGDARLQEWFEYDGLPYYFKIRIRPLETELTKELLQRALVIVKETKNVRSVLESITVELATSHQVSMGMCYRMGHRMTIGTRNNIFAGFIQKTGILMRVKTE